MESVLILGLVAVSLVFFCVIVLLSFEIHESQKEGARLKKVIKEMDDVFSLVEKRLYQS